MGESGVSIVESIDSMNIIITIGGKFSYYLVVSLL